MNWTKKLDLCATKIHIWIHIWKKLTIVYVLRHINHVLLMEVMI
jgi:hypothetical protein